MDARVLALARQHLGLRRAPGLRVRHAEGRAFVAAQRDRSWDAIVIDAFVGAAVAPGLITVQAMADVARVAPLGLVNVVDNRRAQHVRVVIAAMSRAYPVVCALAGRVGNTVVVGSAGRLALERIAAQAAADSSPARLTAPPAIARLVAGTLPVWDEDAAQR